jgi:ribosomal protein S18 acetylase RimI-like enzyme
LAKDQGAKGVSIIVSDANSGARRLYRRCGYREIAKRPMVKEEWENPASRFDRICPPGSRQDARRI